jgi:hypothetical protein
VQCNGAGFAGRVAIIGSAILLASCVSVPQYDATTDTQLSALQSEIDSKLVEWATDVSSPDPGTKAKAGYSKNVDFYNKVDTDMESLELRMEAVPDASNHNLPTYFTNLRQMLTNLKGAQQQLEQQNPPAYLSAGGLTATRWQFAAQFAPLITYELTLKGVASSKSATTKSAATATANEKASAPSH